ncbi:FAD-dependent tricarballylate dehydrogenase TcuA [Nocardia sp. alder85J]|uniref:FAD-dependent tricarballylate dehydrogenase TcuA n=1 Tax=Nocardia sp. alder85J TaxID=2862949 RepID=UPI001CD6D12D|nr:FAD-dependent tricarballylate dehydrogenase TcuA [Nocardia sp. alder85J]MCX4094642.1 FAD-dependent tricarballylate dehydrogenase TcuA [Nocardia sp. alder85J]
MSATEYDVIVAGAGNAGLVAALAAREAGARVLVLEAASHAERGGNSRFSGSIFRAVHDGLDSIRPILADPDGQVLDRVSVAAYGREDYIGDWMSTSQGHPPRELVETVVDRSFDTLRWMRGYGVEWELTANKLFDLDNLDKVYALTPGGAIRVRHEGVGLVAALFAAAENAGIDIWYDAPAHDLITRGATVDGVVVRRADRYEQVRGAVVLASGGFEANPEMRMRYLGPGWDLVKVRGTRFNMGTMLVKALAAGAQPAGHWGGCHASPQDAAHPPVGDLRLTDKLARYSYPYALLVNSDGLRFVDEGEDQVFLTYAKTGGAILRQKGAVAYQIFDRRAAHLLEPRYRTGTPVEADTLAELAALLHIPADTLLATVAGFNKAVADDADLRFDPITLDGVAAHPEGQPPKSNWAVTLDRGPFVAYPVTCGITFTYGGLKIDTEARVLDVTGQPMPGLYATGEIAGDFFHHNYAAGAGLMRGAVFGRIAGVNAAAAS